MDHNQERWRKIEHADTKVPRIADDVQRHLNNEAVIARPPSTLYRLQRFVKRNRTTAISTVLVAASLLAALGVTTWYLFDVSRTNRRLSEQKETIERLYFNQLLGTVMSGNMNVAETVIKEAEHQGILGTETLEYLRGTMYLYGGQPAEAHIHFETCIDLNPRWVLPYSAITMTCIHGGDDQGFGYLEEAEQLAKGVKMDSLTRVLYELPRSIMLVADQGSVDAIRKIAQSETLPLANAFLADTSPSGLRRTRPGGACMRLWSPYERQMHTCRTTAMRSLFASGSTS